MTELQDRSTKIRKGEELAVESLHKYLIQQLPDFLPVGVTEPMVTQFPSGASNLTYLIEYPDVEFVLRKPPFGVKAASAHDMIREAKFIQALKEHYPLVPTVHSICREEGVIGSEFYVMERINGMIPRRNFPRDLSLSEAEVRTLCMNGLDKLIELHQIDYEKTALREYSKGMGYVERQIIGWSKRYRNARTESVPDFESVMSWLEDQPPKPETLCIIHNDFRFDNLIFDLEHPTEVIGVLDWEMATIGDPLMDLGNSLAYWAEDADDELFKAIRIQPTTTPGMLTREQVIDYYAEKTGMNLKPFGFYQVYGLFRLAVIMQQIFYRYELGQTQDKRFAGFGQAVKYLHSRCQKLIASEK